MQSKICTYGASKNCVVSGAALPSPHSPKYSSCRCILVSVRKDPTRRIWIVSTSSIIMWLQIPFLLSVPRIQKKEAKSWDSLKVFKAINITELSGFFFVCLHITQKTLPKSDRSRGSQPSTFSLFDHVKYHLTMTLLGLKHTGQTNNFYRAIHLQRILLA